MKENYIWMDRSGKKYELSDIDDYYLLNILRSMEKGVGYAFFMTEDKINKLFDEADKRKLKYSANKDEAIQMLHIKERQEEIIMENLDVW